MSMYIVKKQKRNHKLVIYDGKKKITEVKPYKEWYYRDTNNEYDVLQVRQIAIDNMYWLLGNNCSFNDWCKYVNNIGLMENNRHKPAFFNNSELYDALKSFYNK